MFNSTGIIPFALLIVLYARVVLTVRERRRSQRDGEEEAEESVVLECYGGGGEAGAATEVYEMTTELSTIDGLTGRAARGAGPFQLGRLWIFVLITFLSRIFQLVGELNQVSHPIN